MPPLDRPLLMWVTDRKHSDAPIPELTGELGGVGIDMIQVREKGLDRLPMEFLVRAIAAIAAPETRIVVNSEIDLARKLRVGVHLPEAAQSIAEARHILGKGALIGRSVHSVESAKASGDADYLIAGHVFETGSKQGRRPLGIDGFAEIVAASPAPVLAIGGVTPERVQDVIAVGAAGVAVMSPLTECGTIGERARDYRISLERTMAEVTGPTVSATINGKASELPAGTTISGFLVGRELHERLVVVERNGEIVKRAMFPDVTIEEGDLLEIVHFVGGG